MGSFLQLWEKTGILGGKVKFEDYRLITYLTLDRAAAEISIHYGQELAVVRKMGGVYHTFWCWFEAVQILKRKSIETNRKGRFDQTCTLRSMTTITLRGIQCLGVWSLAQVAAHQLGELI